MLETSACAHRGRVPPAVRWRVTGRAVQSAVEHVRSSPLARISTLSAGRPRTTFDRAHGQDLERGNGLAGLCRLDRPAVVQDPLHDRQRGRDLLGLRQAANSTAALVRTKTEASGGRANRVPASAASSAANAASTLAASGALRARAAARRARPRRTTSRTTAVGTTADQQNSDQERMRAQERPRARPAVPVRREGGPGGRVGPDHGRPRPTCTQACASLPSRTRSAP